MSLFNKFCHTAHCSCKQSQHRPLKVVLEIYDFFGVGHKYCKIGPQLFPTTLHLVIYISNLWVEQTQFHGKIHSIDKVKILINSESVIPIRSTSSSETPCLWNKKCLPYCSDDSMPSFRSFYYVSTDMKPFN